MEAEAIIVVSVDPTPLHVAGGPTPASVTLRNALPLIADWAAATERYFAAHDRGEQGHRADVRAAYDALVKELEP
jgi:hypothetical protein